MTNSEESNIWAGKKVTKKFVCHHAKWRHLNIFLVLVAQARELRAALGHHGGQSLALRRKTRGKGTPKPLRPPSPGRALRWLGGSLPSLPARQSQAPRQQPLDTDPCLQTQPGGGVGRPECRLAGWGKAARSGGRHQQRGTRSWCERAGPAAGKD